MSAMLILEIFLLFFLHRSIVDSRIEEELIALQARGNSHRDVLETSYKEETLQHISLMESGTGTEVIITDRKGKVITTSLKLGGEEQALLSRKIEKVPREGMVLENRWEGRKY
ncbi:MAG TPA: hypothetical protein VEY51_18175, partial [Chondromyces sp.]|nr:hypothetical protein [Chondromyces sp.]